MCSTTSGLSGFPVRTAMREWTCLRRASLLAMLTQTANPKSNSLPWLRWRFLRDERRQDDTLPVM